MLASFIKKVFFNYLACSLLLLLLVAVVTITSSSPLSYTSCSPSSYEGGVTLFFVLFFLLFLAVPTSLRGGLMKKTTA